MAPAEAAAAGPLQALQRCLERHQAVIGDALLYVDHGAAEAVAAGGGLAALQGALALPYVLSILLLTPIIWTIVTRSDLSYFALPCRTGCCRCVRPGCCLPS